MVSSFCFIGNLYEKLLVEKVVSSFKFRQPPVRDSPIINICHGGHQSFFCDRVESDIRGKTSWKSESIRTGQFIK